MYACRRWPQGRYWWPELDNRRSGGDTGGEPEPHPVAMARRIVAANAVESLHDGMTGAVQVFVSLFEPRTYKRRAAETLLYLRHNRAACRRLGINHHPADARLLAHAAALRRRAAELGRQDREVRP